MPEVFNDIMLNHLKGSMGIGHVRSSTGNAAFRENAQPLVSKYKKGSLTIAHNGNIINAADLEKNLKTMEQFFKLQMMQR